MNAREVPPGGVTHRVVLLSLDGLRPDAIEAFRERTLQRLMREGSHTLATTTIVPSKTRSACGWPRYSSITMRVSAATLMS